ncbi:XK-related protein 6 [Patella vulgata]|uniref:XK-related protein 6 n=1 Tax=Patella vulgata TaxID=6465 RepID=UPI00217F7AD6|nr:XK-related protein 6 [Patella vulgata]XP_050409719.1 XK-related protein 6 [Patella vulgata]
MSSCVPKIPRSRRQTGQLHHSGTQPDVGLARKQAKVFDADQNGDPVTRILIQGDDGKIREVDSKKVVDADHESVTANQNQAGEDDEFIVHDADQPYRSEHDSVNQNGDPGTGHDSVTVNLYQGQDVVDLSVYPKQPYISDDEFKFKCHHFLLGILSGIVLLTDISTDVYLTVEYFREGFGIFGIVTAILVSGASVVVCGYSLYWYYLDYAVNKNDPTWLWVCRIVFSCLQLAILWRTMEYLYYGYKSLKSKNEKTKRKYTSKTVDEAVDLRFLCVFESFLESAPQLVFQLYVFGTLRPVDKDIISLLYRLGKLFVTWIGLSLSLTSYHSSLRNSVAGKKKMGVVSYSGYLAWRVFEVGGRVISLAYFAIYFHEWILLGIGIHWILLSIVNMSNGTSFYENKILNKGYDVCLGYVMIFCFLNIPEGPSKCRLVVYYVIFYIENIVLVVWTSVVNPSKWCWNYVYVVFVIVFSCLHIFLLLLYYKFCHPNKDNGTCLRRINNICSSEDEDNKNML